MDIQYMKGNASNHDITVDFVKHYPEVGIPYLSILCFITVTGTMGNTMVLGAVLTNKVHKFLYSNGMHYHNRSKLFLLNLFKHLEVNVGWKIFNVF